MRRGRSGSCQGLRNPGLDNTCYCSWLWLTCTLFITWTGENSIKIYCRYLQEKSYTKLCRCCDTKYPRGISLFAINWTSHVPTLHVSMILLCKYFIFSYSQPQGKELHRKLLGLRGGFWGKSLHKALMDHHLRTPAFYHRYTAGTIARYTSRTMFHNQPVVIWL